MTILRALQVTLKQIVAIQAEVCINEIHSEVDEPDVQQHLFSTRPSKNFGD